MAKRIRGITIELDGETRGLDKALADVNRRSVELQQELRDVERLLKFDPSNTEALAQKQQLLSQQIEVTTERLNRLRAVQQQVEQKFRSGEIGAEQYRAFRREIQYTESRLNRLQAKLGELDDGKALDNVRDKLKDIAQKADNAQNSVGGLGEALAGTAAGATIGTAVSQALDLATLDTQIEISMEVPPESVEKVRSAVLTVNSFIDDQEAALEGVRRQWALNAEAGDAANTKIVEGAAAITRAYEGIDFVELIQETNEISRSLDISNESALGLVNTLLKMGFPPEQLDIISEYGTQLYEAGYSAKEIQAIFAAGIETGTWNIDNLLDGLKEGRIRLAEFGQEVPKATKELLKGTDISAKQLQEWGRAVAEGGDAGKRAMNEVAQALLNVEDETKRNALGVQIFGTMWEDQGQKVIETILGAKDQQVDFTENQKQLNEAVNQLNEDPAVRLKQAFDELKVALEPVLDPIADFVSKIAEWVKNNPQLASTITLIVGALTIFFGILAVLGPIIAGIAAFVGTLAAAFGVASSTVLIIIGVIAALIAIGIALWKNWDTIKAKALEIWENIKNWLAEKWEQIKSYARDKWEQMKQHIADKLEQAKERIESIWNRVENFFENIDLVQTGKDIIQGLIDGIISLKDRVLRKAQEIADGIKSRIKSVLGITSPSKVMMDFGKDTAEGFILGIESMFGEIRRVSDQLAQVAIQPASEADSSASRGETGVARIASAPVEIHVMLDGQQIMPTIRRELTFDLDAALKGVR